MKKLLVILSALLLTGCSAVSEYKSEFMAMDTYMVFTVMSEDESTAEAALDESKRLVLELENKWSSHKDSEITELNRNRTIKASEDTYKLIETALEAGRLTNGCFDISIYPLIKLWGFGTDDARVPAKKDIREALSKTGMENIVPGPDGEISLLGDCSIDLGGIAKGAAAGYAVQSLKANGITSGILNLGGNICCIGDKNGDSWKVGIADPERKRDYICALSVKDTYVVTSGGYERYFETEDWVYHHILNPRTGYPAGEYNRSVTVVCSDAAMADALSTGCFVMGVRESFELEKNSELDFSLIWYEGGRLYVSSDLKGSLSSELEVVYK